MKTYKEANQAIFETALVDKDSADESLNAALTERIEEKRAEMKKQVAQNLFLNEESIPNIVKKHINAYRVSDDPYDVAPEKVIRKKYIK